MLKEFFSPVGFWQDNAITLSRIVVGSFMIYHGIEVFDRAKMTEYAKMLTDLKMGSSLLMAYLGKACELISGCLLFLGLFTRIASLILAINMLMITFRIGEGRFFMEEQYPFLFVLFAIIFFFSGGGKWSLDRLLFKTKNKKAV